MKFYNYSLQHATGLKPPLQILFLKFSESKACSKISKIIKNLSKNVSSFLTQQAWSLELPASAEQTPLKIFPVSVVK